MNARSRALRHIDKVLLLQREVPDSLHRPHFLFDSPVFTEHQLTITELPQHMDELELAEWGCAEVAPALAGIDLGGMELESQS